MSAPPVMIDDMKSMPWPLALVVTVTVLVIGVLAVLDKDVNVVMNAILFLLMALGYAELREVKSNTNGTNTKLMQELTETRRDSRMREWSHENPPPHPPDSPHDHAP